MTDAEKAILITLRALADLPSGKDAWHPVSAVGGKTSTYHATTLRRMAAAPKCWVESRRRFEDRPRAGLEWRITAKGRQALVNAALVAPATVDA